MTVSGDGANYRPPRLLLGVALLFCGWMQQMPAPYLLGAILVESAHWYSRRFELADRAFVRAWQLGWLMAGLVLFSIWIDGLSYGRLTEFSGLIPLFLLPLVVVEAYSEPGTTPVTTFSYFSRRKKELDRKRGRPVEDHRVAIGYPYLVIILVAAGMGAAGVDYTSGLVAMVLFALWSRLRQNSKRWLALFLVLLSAGGMAYLGVTTIQTLRGMMSSGEHMSLAAGRELNPKYHQTGLGRIHHLKQSSRILWKLESEEGLVPSLLRESTYSAYQGTMWRNPEQIDFSSLISLPQAEAMWGFPKPGDMGMLSTHPAYSSRVRIRGDVQKYTVLPLPDHPTRLDELRSYDVSINPYACVRMEEPSQTVVDFAVEFGSESGLEAVPSEWDSQVTESEREGVRVFVERHQLRGMELSDLIAKLRFLFNRDFQYSLNVTQADLGKSAIERATVLSHFLNEGHVGYCEYFAGATVMILRECGYPCRYAVGFSVQEKKGDTNYVLRGTHAHAWARVYDEGRWRDVDLTPPDWLAADDRRNWLQSLIDTLFDLRQRITLWRLEGRNSALVNRSLAGVGAVIALLIGWRLWWAYRRGLLRSKRSGFRRGRRLREFRRIEALLVREIGPRRADEGVVAWLERLRKVRPDLTQEVDALARQYAQQRFDPCVEPSSELLQRACDGLRKGLKEVPEK